MIISLKLVHFPGSRLATRVPGGVTRRIPGYPPDQRGGVQIENEIAIKYILQPFPAWPGGGVEIEKWTSFFQFSQPSILFKD